MGGHLKRNLTTLIIVSLLSYYSYFYISQNWLIWLFIPITLISFLIPALIKSESLKDESDSYGQKRK